MKESERDSRIETEEDFVVSKKHNNSLSRLLEDYPDGVPDKVICKVLQITPDDLKRHYKCAIMNLKITLE